jgi:hypothetical protein
LRAGAGARSVHHRPATTSDPWNTTMTAAREPLPPSLQPSEISEERAAQLLAWQREDERARRREFWGTIAAMVASSAIGCVIMAQGWRVTDKALGMIWVSGGILTGQALILAILVRAWLRAQREE